MNPCEMMPARTTTTKSPPRPLPPSLSRSSEADVGMWKMESIK